MSAPLMQQAFDAIENDPRLHTADKLVLLRWAWKSRPGVPYEIRFKSMARDLHMTRNGVRTSVRRLIALGYLYPTSVKVIAGPAFQVRGAQTAPRDNSRGGSSSDPQGVTGNPPKGLHRDPLPNKKEKEGPNAEETLEWIRAGTGLPFEQWRRTEGAKP